MLFLTATPFQLGHHELCSVLERFEGIAWNVPSAPRMRREIFRLRIRELRERLDAAQTSALNLDAAWGRLRVDDLELNGQHFDVNTTWRNGGLRRQGPLVVLPLWTTSWTAISA